MLASKILPVSDSERKSNFTCARDVMLRSLVDSLEAASCVPVARRIAELAGAEYVGPQATPKGTLHYFREPVTGTSICVWDAVLTLDTLGAAMKAARFRFGVEVLS